LGKRITLSAGAVGSPTILLRSGIGPSGDLRRQGIEPTVESLGVGANLIDHPRVGITLQSNDGLVDDTTPHWQVVLRYSAPGSTEWNDMQVLVSHSTQPPATSLTASVMRPRSRGMLRLVDRNPHTPPAIALNLAADPEDVRRLAAGLRLLTALVQSPLLAPFATRTAMLNDGRVLPVEEALTSLASDEAIDAYIRQTVSHYVHPVGTARMGPDGDLGAVVDQYCCVRGVDGLRVVDASVMPHIPRAPLSCRDPQLEAQCATS
jgi:choline dehydrogenase